MTYSTISRCVADAAFATRVNACIAQEQLAKGDTSPEPDTMTGPMLWSVASASDVEGAYAYALNAGNPNPGGDETVITDGMILSNVQAHWFTPTTPA